MNKLLVIVVATMLLGLGACHSHNEHEKHNHNAHAHDHENTKLQIAAYSSTLEAFVESDPLIKGEEAVLLTHLTLLESFVPVTEGRVKAILNIEGEIAEQTLDKPVRDGIYRFTLTPTKAGKATISFVLTQNGTSSTVASDSIAVFSDTHKAIHYAEDHNVHSNTATTFTKEQSWKVRFRTDPPRVEPFGPVIRSYAKVDVGQSASINLAAMVGGTIRFNRNAMVPGVRVRKGDVLLSIESDGARDNAASIYTEAKASYEKAKIDYKRIAELSKDNLIAKKELVQAKAELAKTEANYNSIAKSVTAKGQLIIAPVSGYVDRVLVSNGSYIEQGTPLLVLAEENNLLLTAEVSQRYGLLLDQIAGATLRTSADSHTIDLNEINGRLISVGKGPHSGSNLIPISFSTTGHSDLYPGSLVEMYIKTKGNHPVITVPNNALLEDQGHYFLFVQLTPELFEKQEVTIGSTDGLRTEIKTGIKTDQRIVTQGAILVKLAAVSGALDPHAGHVH